MIDYIFLDKKVEALLNLMPFKVSKQYEVNINILNKLNKQLERKKINKKLIESIFFDIISYLGIKKNYIRLVIIPIAIEKQQPFGTFLSVGKRGGEIELFLRQYFTSNTIIAVLCHELTHYFLELNGLNANNQISEVDTDITSILLGFGKYMLEGYNEIEQIKNHNFPYKISSSIGYLSKEEINYVYKKYFYNYKEAIF